MATGNLWCETVRAASELWHGTMRVACLLAVAREAAAQPVAAQKEEAAVDEARVAQLLGIPAVLAGRAGGGEGEEREGAKWVDIGAHSFWCPAARVRTETHHQKVQQHVSQSDMQSCKVMKATVGSVPARRQQAGSSCGGATPAKTLRLVRVRSVLSRPLSSCSSCVSVSDILKRDGSRVPGWKLRLAERSVALSGHL